MRILILAISVLTVSALASTSQAHPTALENIAETWRSITVEDVRGISSREILNQRILGNPPDTGMLRVPKPDTEPLPPLAPLPASKQ